MMKLNTMRTRLDGLVIFRGILQANIVPAFREMCIRDRRPAPLQGSQYPALGRAWLPFEGSCLRCV